MDDAYHRRRAAQERAVAARSDNPQHRNLHIQLAELHEARIGPAEAAGEWTQPDAPSATRRVRRFPLSILGA